MGYTSIHASKNLQLSFIFPFLYFACHDFSVLAPFEVLSWCYSKNDIIMMECEIRKQSFDALTPLKLNLWRQDIEPPNWLTKTKSKEGTKDRPWPDAKINRKMEKKLLYNSVKKKLSYNSVERKLSYKLVEQNLRVIHLNETFLWSGWTKHPRSTVTWNWIFKKSNKLL